MGFNDGDLVDGKLVGKVEGSTVGIVDGKSVEGSMLGDFDGKMFGGLVGGSFGRFEGLIVRGIDGPFDLLGFF